MVQLWIGMMCGVACVFITFFLHVESNASSLKNFYTSAKSASNYNDTNQLYHNPKHNKKSFIFNTKIKNCTVIHIGMVCAEYNSTVTLVITVKSILFYCNRPIHFHLLVDNIALENLSVLFTTWNIPHVFVSFYRLDELIPKVSWVPNKHYSGIYGLLKLVFSDIIYKEKIIILDTDIILLRDVSLLWELFNGFNSDQVMGLIENQSNWYIKPVVQNTQSSWPALGRGFNTGIMLLNLDQLRKINFTRLWETIAKNVLKYIYKTSLADQDIINAVSKVYPTIIHLIDCSWNVQLSDHSFSESCYSNIKKLNVIHWNSPKKQNVRNKYTEDFKKMRDIFLELNGNLLRRQIIGCDSYNKLAPTREIGTCFDFKKGGNIVYRTHPFFLEYNYYGNNSVDVFLATQCSIDRIVLLENLSKHWSGVISIALYVTDAEVQNALYFIQNSIELRNRRNIAYHVVYKEGEFYPVNYLRNVAMAYITIPFVFQIDIDFLPQKDLHELLISYIMQLNVRETRNVALVVPAFETQRYKFVFPSSKTELSQYLDLGIFYTFRYHVWPQGHAPTNFTLYRNAKAPYEVEWEPDFEPYVVVSKSSPIYDTRFVGFGWNKVSYITHLKALGYKFIVIPDVFIIHKSHAPSRDIERFRTDSLYRRCLKELKETFVKDLIRKYGSKAAENIRTLYNYEDRMFENNTN